MRGPYLSISDTVWPPKPMDRFFKFVFVTISNGCPANWFSHRTIKNSVSFQVNGIFHVHQKPLTKTLNIQAASQLYKPQLIRLGVLCTWPQTLFASYGSCILESSQTLIPFNPLKPELNPICYLLALLGAHHFLHVSRIRVKILTLRRLMSYIYGAPILDVSRSHTTTQHSR